MVEPMLKRVTRENRKQLSACRHRSDCGVPQRERQVLQMKSRLLVIHFVLVISFIEPAAGAFEPRLKSDQEPFKLYPNPNATDLYEPVFDSSYFPIVCGWGPEIYISDSLGYYNPCIAKGGSQLHVFADRRRPHHYISRDNGETWEFYADLYDSTFSESDAGMRASVDGLMLYLCWNGYRSDLIYPFVCFMSSSDEGTWPIRRELRVPGVLFSQSKYPDVAAFGDTVFVSFIHQPPDSLTCFRSTDRGVHWTNPRFIGRHTAALSPTIAYTAGVVHIAYNEDCDQNATDVMYVRSTDHGATWQIPQYLGFPDGNHGQWPQVAADTFGNVAVCWMDYIGSPYWFTGGIWCRVSHDFGVSWGEAVRLDDDYLGEVNQGLEIEGDFVAVSWATDIFGLHRLHYRESSDGGQTWGEDQVLSAGRCLDPRLLKAGPEMHLIWSEEEPPIYRRYIKYMKNDGLPQGVDDNGPVSPKTIFIKAYPNPFNSGVTLLYSFQNEKGGEICIYNIRGQLINHFSAPGKEGQIKWDACDAVGNKVSSGIYFARARASQSSQTIKLIYLK